MQQENRQLTSTDLHVVTNDKQETLGAVGVTADYRMFRYCSIGSSNVGTGLVLGTPATGTNYLGLSVQAAVTASNNALTVNITLGGTAITQDMFMDGSLDIISGTGAGTSYRVRGNSTQTSTSGVVQVFLYEPILASLDTTSKVNICPNLWAGLTSQLGAGSSADNPKNAAVTVQAMNANQYGWCQVEGRCMCSNDGTAAIYRGLAVRLSANAGSYGQVCTVTGNSDADKQIVGNAMEHSAATAGLFVPIYLTIV